MTSVVPPTSSTTCSGRPRLNSPRKGAAPAKISCRLPVPGCVIDFWAGGALTRIDEHQVRCSCGHEFRSRLHTTVNTQLSPEAVEEFLRGRLNRPECPACGAVLWVLIPVLFNDMEREFMVWVGSGERPDGYVQDADGLSTIVYVGNYLAALAALVAFRAEPTNAVVPFKEMDTGKARDYVERYLRIYERLKGTDVPVN